MEQIKNNCENLMKVRPDLAAWVSWPLPPRVELVVGKGQVNTLVYHTAQGERVLHSRYDPLREGQNLASSLIGDWDHLVMMGLGLGYALLYLLDLKAPEQRILVYEPDPAIFSASLAVIDWGQLLSSRTDLFLFVGDSERGLSDEVQRFFSISSYDKLQIVHFPPEKPLFPEPFKRAEAIIDSQIKTLIFDFKTRLAEGGMVSQNILGNLPLILQTRAVHHLENRFQERPGIIVSAGPSLDDNLPLLKRVRDRAVIVAVDTALKPLLARGVQPHFTVSADPSYKNYRHLMGTEGRIKHHLLTESAVSTRVYQDFRPYIFTVTIGKPLLSFCEAATGPIGELDAWGSVISLAFSFALYLGLDPLTFVGQDFAYTHLRNHCRHSTWEESVLLESPSLESLQRFERQSIGDTVREVSDIFGGRVFTSERFALYRDYLERMVRTQSGRSMFNSSEGGIFKALPFLPLDEFLTRYLSGTQAIDFGDLQRIPTLGGEKVNAELKRMFTGQVRFLKRYLRKVTLMNKRLAQPQDDSSETLIDEAENLRQALYHLEAHGNLVEMWSQFPIYTFLRGQKKLKGELSPTVYRQRLGGLYKNYFQALGLQLGDMVSAFEELLMSL